MRDLPMQGWGAMSGCAGYVDPNADRASIVKLHGGTIHLRRENEVTRLEKHFLHQLNISRSTAFAVVTAVEQ